MASVLITGASTGIGEASARRLAVAGHRVFAGVRREEDAERLRRDVPAAEPLLLDVTDGDQVAASARHLDRVLGTSGLDGVVNNAGIAVGGPVEHLPLDEWRRQLEVNVLGPVAVTQALLPHLRRARGRVVFVGSISGRVSTPLVAPYGASKHAVEALAESLREELRPWGLRVSLIEPGAVRTPIWTKGRADADRLERELPPEALQQYDWAIAKIRAGIDEQERTGVDPDRVAKAVEHALTASRPKYRYLVGVDARVGGLADRFLPDRALSAVLRRMGP